MQTQTHVTVYFNISSYVVIKYKHSPCSHSGPTLHSPKSICYMWMLHLHLPLGAFWAVTVSASRESSPTVPYGAAVALSGSTCAAKVLTNTSHCILKCNLPFRASLQYMGCCPPMPAAIHRRITVEADNYARLCTVIVPALQTITFYKIHILKSNCNRRWILKWRVEDAIFIPTLTPAGFQRIVRHHWGLLTILYQRSVECVKRHSTYISAPRLQFKIQYIMMTLRTKRLHRHPRLTGFTL